jgi:hypothetical protein
MKVNFLLKKEYKNHKILVIFNEKTLPQNEITKFCQENAVNSKILNRVNEIATKNVNFVEVEIESSSSSLCRKNAFGWEISNCY